MSLTSHSRRQKGFTLVELMVAVAIIGILVAVASISYKSIRLRGRDAQRINDLNQVKVVLSLYYGAQTPQVYPTQASKLTITGSDALSTTLENGGYIRDMPVDPLNTGNYVYKYISGANSKSFTLYGTLENTDNKKGWAGGSAWVIDGLEVKSE